MKIAIFCENRFKENNQFNKNIDANLSPYIEVTNLLGQNNCITYDLLDINYNKDDYIIITWLPINIFSLPKYFSLFLKYRKNKKYLFLKEPPVVAKIQYIKFFHYFFDRIYTWNDDLVDNKKYFKLIWQISKNGYNTEIVDFDKKKLLTLINANKFSLHKNELYSKREESIRFFENKNLIDLYGHGWGKPNLKQKITGFNPYKSYLGKIDNKHEVLSKYKFNICFENMCNVKGYITEKIWDSFKAKSVPIYWGASNIDEYIPKNCYIDFRDFNCDYEKLLNFILKIDKTEYNKYINNIIEFLDSKEANKWFDEEWAKFFVESIK